MYKENITVSEILLDLDALIGQWARDRQPDECFGDFVIRSGVIGEVVISKRDFYD
jgi:sulfite reductase (NADPH) hemoprotein beta-component